MVVTMSTETTDKKRTIPTFQVRPNWTMLSQGAEARVWKIPSFLYENQAAVAKERFPKTYRHPILDQRLTKSRGKAEAKALTRARRGGVACPAVWGIQWPVLYLEFLDGPTVRQELERISKSIENASIDERTEMRESVAKKVGSLIAKLHNTRTIHGDLTTSNMIILSPDIYLIDFGLSRVSQNPEELAVDLYVLERAIQSTHPELDDTPFFSILLNAYKETGNKSDAVLQRLSAVRLRGRKRECFG
mmetsp:Transcript_15743/g.23171  ORF Transcript_15743/g.23171 Transcript_15743/m.23171 type:complete len:247 (+) Transcript_15743:60-800(+)